MNLIDSIKQLHDELDKLTLTADSRDKLHTLMGEFERQVAKAAADRRLDVQAPWKFVEEMKAFSDRREPIDMQAWIEEKQKPIYGFMCVRVPELEALAETHDVVPKKKGA